MTNIMHKKILKAYLSFSTTASSRESPGDSNNDRQPETATGTGNTYTLCQTALKF